MTQPKKWCITWQTTAFVTITLTIIGFLYVVEIDWTQTRHPSNTQTLRNMVLVSRAVTSSVHKRHESPSQKTRQGHRNSNGNVTLLCRGDCSRILKELSKYKRPNKERVHKHMIEKEGFDLKPPVDFLADYRNPCWFSKRGSLRCLPYCYLLGFTKSATTDLWTRMTKHPSVIGSSDGLTKEMHWWGRGRYASGGTRLLGNYYSKHYGETLAKSARNKSRIMCDGSPDTIWNPGITMEAQLRASRSYFHLVPAPTVLPASLIKEFTPKAKFVIIMRNPTERLFSHYRYRGPSTNVDSHLNRTLENFDAGVKQMKPILDFCFEKKSIRDCAYDPAFLLDGERTRVLLQVGLYVVYIKDWLTVFPRNQFYFTTTEEYGANPNRVMKEIFQFLDLDMGQNPEKMLNDVIATYWPGHNSVDLGPMWPRTKRKLDAFYEPFNEALATLLNDVKYLWRSDTDNL